LRLYAPEPLMLRHFRHILKKAFECWGRLKRPLNHFRPTQAGRNEAKEVLPCKSSQ